MLHVLIDLLIDYDDEGDDDDDDETIYFTDSWRAIGWLALNRVHNSRWPLDRLFALCDPVTLIFDLLT